MSYSLSSILETVNIRQHIVSFEVYARWMNSLALSRIIIHFFFINLTLRFPSHHHQLPLRYYAIIVVHEKVEFDVTGIAIFVFTGLFKAAFIDYFLLVVLVVTHKTWVTVPQVVKVFLYNKVRLVARSKVLLFERLKETSFSIGSGLRTLFLFKGIWWHEITSGVH